MEQREKIILSIEEKLEILKPLQKGTLYTMVLEKYAIGQSRVADIKKNELKLKAFKAQNDRYGNEICGY